MKSNTLILTILLSTSVFASDEKCSSVDLRNDVLGPARNQGQIGWCFAHAAADLISFKLGHKISVTELGTTYFKHRRGSSAELWEKEGFREGGWVSAALKIAVKNDVCLEKDLPTEDFQLVSDTQKLYTLSTIPNAIDSFTHRREKLVNLEAPPRIYIELPHLMPAEVDDILFGNPMKKAWEQIVDRSCESRKVSIKGLEVKSPFFSHIFDSVSFKVIDRELDRKNVVGISYFAQFLYNIDAKKRGRHASVLVGRRFNEKTKSCEYLIRNSWGTACSSYDRRLYCEKGHVWVPKKLLEKHLNYVDYLKGEIN